MWNKPTFATLVEKGLVAHKLYYQPFRINEFIYLQLNEFTIGKELIQNTIDFFKDPDEPLKIKFFAIFIIPWYLYKLRKYEILRYK